MSTSGTVTEQFGGGADLTDVSRHGGPCGGADGVAGPWAWPAARPAVRPAARGFGRSCPATPGRAGPRSTPGARRTVGFTTTRGIQTRAAGIDGAAAFGDGFGEGARRTIRKSGCGGARRRPRRGDRSTGRRLPRQLIERGWPPRSLRMCCRPLVLGSLFPDTSTRLAAHARRARPPCPARRPTSPRRRHRIAGPGGSPRGGRCRAGGAGRCRSRCRCRRRVRPTHALLPDHGSPVDFHAVDPRADTKVINIGPRTAEDPAVWEVPRSESHQVDRYFVLRARRESNPQPSDP